MITLYFIQLFESIIYLVPPKQPFWIIPIIISEFFSKVYITGCIKTQSRIVIKYFSFHLAVTFSCVRLCIIHHFTHSVCFGSINPKKKTTKNSDYSNSMTSSTDMLLGLQHGDYRTVIKF